MTDDESSLRLLLLGAHPDDAEFHAGGLVTRYTHRGHRVRIISVTDGGAGHHRHERGQLVEIRRQEAAAAGAQIGAEYFTWDFPDGRLTPSLDVRERIIREIRSFQPDLVLTHRTCDYHPDHRAVGQAVQDASYLVTVPMICPDTPILPRDPVVAYMCDLFTRPCELRPDIVLDIREQMPSLIRMLACHQSQVFEFLPFNLGLVDQVPADRNARESWLTDWYGRWIERRADQFRQAAVEQLGEQRGRDATWIEAYEISEYAGRADAERRKQLFCCD